MNQAQTNQYSFCSFLNKPLNNSRLNSRSANLVCHEIGFPHSLPESMLIKYFGTSLMPACYAIQIITFNNGSHPVYVEFRFMPLDFGSEFRIQNHYSTFLVAFAQKDTIVRNWNGRTALLIREEDSRQNELVYCRFRHLKLTTSMRRSASR